MELKRKKTYRYIIFKIDEKAQQIILEATGGPEESYEDFASHLPENDCRYGVYDFDFVTDDNCQKSKIFFVAWWAISNAKISLLLCSAILKFVLAVYYYPPVYLHRYSWSCLWCYSCCGNPSRWSWKMLCFSCIWDCAPFSQLVCLCCCMMHGKSTITLFIPGPQTHHELRLKWLMQAQRTDSGGNWMAFIMSFRPQTLLKWAWMSWEIVLTKKGEFVLHLINFGSLDFRFQGSFLSAFILNSRKPWTLVFVGYIRTCLLFLLMCILSECTIHCVLYASSDPFEIPEWYCRSAML